MYVTYLVHLPLAVAVGQVLAEAALRVHGADVDEGQELVRGAVFVCCGGGGVDVSFYMFVKRGACMYVWYTYIHIYMNQLIGPPSAIAPGPSIPPI